MLSHLLWPNVASTVLSYKNSSWNWLIDQFDVWLFSDANQRWSIPLSFVSLVFSSIKLFYSQRLGRFPNVDPSAKEILVVAPFIGLQVDISEIDFIITILLNTCFKNQLQTIIDHLITTSTIWNPLHKWSKQQKQQQL